MYTNQLLKKDTKRKQISEFWALLYWFDDRRS